MVISGGVNVYPAEVEGVLEAHPDVAEVAVVGVPDREWGERVRAFVVKKAGLHARRRHAQDLRARASRRPEGAARLRLPRALPRNPTGKVLKRELRSLAT